VDVFGTHLGLVRGRTNATPDDLLRLLDDHWSGTEILAGDFNALPSGPLLKSLAGADAPRARAFQDVWTGARSGPKGGTFHWGLGLPGPRLDYVLVRPPCTIESVRIAGTRVGRILPSDHYAVVADLRIDDPHDEGGHARQPLRQVLGTWAGTSTCVGNRPACKDEKGLWEFTVSGDSIVGTLVLLPGRDLARRVRVHRVAEGSVPPAPAD
jgi:hypothetical protein